MDIRIPRTASRRGAVHYTKLLHRVDAKARDGFGFEGKFLEPGSTIDDSTLRLSNGHNAVLLESTDVEGPWNVPRRRRTWERLYILWRWDVAQRIWIEIARATHNEGQWAQILREPARLALGRASWTVIPSVAESSERIRKFIELELANAGPEQERQIMADVHDQLAARIVKAGVA